MSPIASLSLLLQSILDGRKRERCTLRNINTSINIRNSGEQKNPLAFRTDKKHNETR